MSGRAESGAHPMTGPGADPHPDVRSHLRDDGPARPPAGPPPGAFDGPDVPPAPPTTGPPGAFDGPPVVAGSASPVPPDGADGAPRHVDDGGADPRWARLAGDFVDEPQQAVDAARRMVRDAVEALLADVDPGVDGVGGATRADAGDGDGTAVPGGTDTERLRQAFRRYRDLHSAVARL